jgi:hypothetical protein
LDGAVTNSCVVVGGLVQLLVQGPTTLTTTTDDAAAEAATISVVDNTIYVPEFFRVNQTDNVTIRGMTFSGNIVVDPVFGGTSVAISNPSRNFRMVDCLWENITSSMGLIVVGTNVYQQITKSQILFSRVVDVTLERCTFRNIVYDGPVIETLNQNITLRGARFENVTLSPYLRTCILDHEALYYVCEGLVYCLGEDSVCALHDICVSDLEYVGMGAVLIVNNQSLVTLSGSFFSSGIEQQQHHLSSSSSSFSSLASLGANSTVQGPGQCASGISRLAADFMSYDCVEEGEYGSWTSTTICPLL